MRLLLWLQNKGRLMTEEGRARRESGEIDIGGILVMGIGMVFLAVGFIMYPIIMTACDALLAYQCAANTTFNATGTGVYENTINSTYFTGFVPIVGITPLLVLIGFLSAAVFAMYLGVKIMKGGAGGTKLDMGTMLLLGISLIFIAIGLIILPVTLDAICDVLSPAPNDAYVGLAAILRVTPLLILISFVSGAVVTGFFGIKRLTG